MPFCSIFLGSGWTMTFMLTMSVSMSGDVDELGHLDLRGDVLDLVLVRADLLRHV